MCATYSHLTLLFSSLRDKRAGQEANQANSGASNSGDPAAENVCEDADDGRAEKDHPH